MSRLSLTAQTLHQNRLIGVGLSQKIYNKRTGGLADNTGMERIYQSIYCILNTMLGERVFLPEFGSRLHELVFEPNDEIVADLAKLYICDALAKWEKRITVTDVYVRANDHTVACEIRFVLNKSNILGNYIYEFNRFPSI